MTVCAKADDGSLLFWCPGCQMHHGPVVERTEKRPSGPLWNWNGSLESPTLSPSILVRGDIPFTEEEVDKVLSGETVEHRPFCCHSYVRNGQIEFLSDCTHKLAGQTVAMEEWK